MHVLDSVYTSLPKNKKSWTVTYLGREAFPSLSQATYGNVAQAHDKREKGV